MTEIACSRGAGSFLSRYCQRPRGSDGNLIPNFSQVDPKKMPSKYLQYGAVSDADCLENMWGTDMFSRDML